MGVAQFLIELDDIFHAKSFFPGKKMQLWVDWNNLKIVNFGKLFQSKGNGWLFISEKEFVVEFPSIYVEAILKQKNTSIKIFNLDWPKFGQHKMKTSTFFFWWEKKVKWFLLGSTWNKKEKKKKSFQLFWTWTEYLVILTALISHSYSLFQKAQEIDRARWNP